jgi:hypothetical protein
MEQSNMNTQHTASSDGTFETWPSLPYEAWMETRHTLHLWMQIVGKVKMELSPFMNHWWHVPLALTARGLTTSTIPYQGRVFEVDFDFIGHNLFISTGEGALKALPLMPRSVADFYREFMEALRALDINVTINTLPSEVAHPIPCDEDVEHASYDPVYANRFWRILLHTAAVMNRYRSPFLGKSSPVQFFWGGFDMALSLFSGRPAPERPGANRMMRESVSHEEISCGFWPGDERYPAPAFYAYTSPEPPGLKSTSIRPPAAFYSHELGEFLLNYNDVRNSASPEQALLDFFQSTYEAGATLAKWDREALERH